MKHNPGHGIESFCCSTKVDVAKFAVTAADTSPSVPSRDKTANGERYFYSPCGSKRCRLRNLIKKILNEARLSFIDSRGKRKSREMKRFEPLLFKLSRTKFDRYFFLKLSLLYVVSYEREQTIIPFRISRAKICAKIVNCKFVNLRSLTSNYRQPSRRETLRREDIQMNYSCTHTRCCSFNAYRYVKLMT